MISASPVDDTEVFKVKVTCGDPYEAAKIANCIAEVLPERISEIIDGSKMEVVDVAVPNTNKVSPSITNYTAIGMMIGLLLACGVITIFVILDNTIQDEDYIVKVYDYPILAKVPDLLDSEAARFNYYSYTQSLGKKGGK
jgi:capsular polysaccharide biosynthesis protein